MAPTHSAIPWLAGACLLSTSAAQDADAERFPLAGGVPIGVTVTVKGKFADSDMANLDFITPDQSMASGYRVRRSSNAVNRELSSGTTQSWGNAGFAMNSDSEMDEFQFLKMSDSFAVSVNGKRAPWYDVDLSSFPDRGITHLNVGSGISDAEVVLRRTACSTPCHAAECELDLGNSTCVVNDETRPASECMTTSPSGCTADSQTDEAGMQDVTCCNGMGRNIRWKENVNWAWAAVPDDASTEDACDAYSVDSDICKGFKGKFVKVTGREPASNTAAVWSASSIGCKTSSDRVSVCDPQPASIAYNVPMDILFQRAPTVQRIDLTYAQLKLSGWKFEIETRAITSAPSTLSMLAGKYVSLMHETAEEDKAPHGPWTLWIQSRWGYWKGASSHVGMSLMVADFPIDLPTCTDLSRSESSTEPWTTKGTKGGLTCDAHCEDTSNMEGGGGGSLVPSSCSGCWIAQKACCKCGGGTYGGDFFNVPLPYAYTTIENAQAQVS